jgi:hypothetical protein
MKKGYISLNLDFFINEYRKGKTFSEIANEFNVNRNTLKTIFKRKKIPMRNSGSRRGRIPWNKGKEYLSIKGNKNPNWKGGITNLNQQIRHCYKYKKWINDIFIRDKYTCQKCNKVGGNLEVDHHPKKFSDILKENNIDSLEKSFGCNELWDIINGRTLCLKCHNRTKQVRSRFKKVHSNKK